MTETIETKTEYRIVHTYGQQAMVVEVRGETMRALHDYLISPRAADWLMKDLKSDPDKLDGIGEEMGHNYDKAVQFMDMLDFNQSPQVNAFELAKDAIFGPRRASVDFDPCRMHTFLSAR